VKPLGVLVLTVVDVWLAKVAVAPPDVVCEAATGTHAAPKQPVVLKVTISARATFCPSAIIAMAARLRAKHFAIA
jgi:hypothetical protein